MTTTPPKTLRHYRATARSPLGTMPVRYALLFLHVASAKSYNNLRPIPLAEELGWPRPLVYRVISSLIAAGLLERVGRRIALTDFGREVAQKIKDETNGR